VIGLLLFDFMNGFHDGEFHCHHRLDTRSPHQAVIWAAGFNFIAYFLFPLKVALTGKGTIDPSIVDHYIIFGALVGAIVWNIITWYYRIPSSLHRMRWLAAWSVQPWAKAWVLAVSAGVLKIIAFIFVAPFLGFVIGGTLMVIVSWICRDMAPRKVDKHFRRLQLLSAAAYSLGHGGNDAQNGRHYLDAADCGRNLENKRRNSCVGSRLTVPWVWGPCLVAGVSSRPWAIASRS
jgi:PiT family inorganic phosphate transporter